MATVNQFKHCLKLALERSYLLDRWIGDLSLVDIFLKEFKLDYINKRYINTHLPNIVANNIKIHSYTQHKILYPFSTILYDFTEITSINSILIS